MFAIRVFILALLVSLAAPQSTSLAILFVSGSPSTVSSPVYSSLRGGRMIYIKAIGHSPNPTQNLVYVGSIPCTIPSDGVTDTFISCVTGDSGSSTDLPGYLTVSLISYGSRVTSASPNVVYYVNSWTPQLYAVFPTAGYGGQNVNLYGVHDISNIGDGLRNMGDITKLQLGSDLCSRFDVIQNGISGTSNQNLLCIASNQQQAGKYNVSEQVVPGYAAHNLYLRRSSFDPNQYFEYTALPTITSVSPAAGNIGGQYLTISGNGFSPNPNNNTVTVDGNNCQVTSSGNSQITCTLDPRNTTLNTQLPTNSTSQQNGFFGGAGVQYARYSVTDPISTVASFVSAVRVGNTTLLGNPQEVGYRADIREGDVYGSYYGQVWKGYFKAPVSGTYTFRGLADDLFAVYFSTTYGSTEIPQTPLINSDNYQVMDHFYINDYSTAQANVTLQGNRSYYFQAYHINLGYGGFFDLQVQVPNTDKTASFQAYQVDEFTTNATIQPEVWNYTMSGGSTGIIMLQISRTTPAYLKQVNISYGCTADTFAAALNSFNSFAYYGVTVVRNIYDSGNRLINSTTGAARIEYIASIQWFRTSYTSEKFTVKYYNYTGTFIQTSLQSHSPLISGTFTLTIAGVAIQYKNSSNLPYNIDAATLQASIRASPIVGFGLVQVDQTAVNSNCGYSCTWIIQYKGFNAAVPSLVVNPAQLSGGSTTPSITSFTRRSYSSRIVFDPIDYRFLSTYSNSISVQVSTNKIPAICNGSCSYSFYTYSQITSLTYSGSTLLLSISDPTALAFPISSISITVGGNDCQIDPASTLSALTCYLQNNTDNTPILYAGTLVPIVSIGIYGIVGLAPSVTPPTIPLIVSTLSVLSAGNNGGISMSILGSGFPVDPSLIKISVCNNLATIQASSNIKIDFYLPACGTLGLKPVIVTVGSLSNSSLSITYTDGSATAPTIYSLNPNSANPGVKGTLEIIGNRFGNDASAVQVFLSNATGKVYPLTVLKINNTYIKVGLPGGEAGSFIVQVNVGSLGDSVASTASSNVFNYVFSVSSISPTSGSYYGGTLLTIKGVNFSPDYQQTLVYVGETLNWYCNIEQINATTILCRTPPISTKYTPGTPVSVVVSTRLLILNSCTGSCSFTYVNSSLSPALTYISLTKTNVGAITVNGTRLLDPNGGAVVISLTDSISGVTTVVTPTATSNTSVTFNITANIISSSYLVKVRNSLGESNGLSLNVYWNPGTVSWPTNASTAGAIVSLTNGAGYPSSIDGVSFSLAITSGGVSYPVNIISCCSSNSITFQIPSAPSGTVFSIVFTGPTNTIGKVYTAVTTYTPAATITGVTSALNATVGAKNITFKPNFAYNATIQSIRLVSTLNSSYFINVTNWTTTGSGVNAITTFAATLSAGSYKLRVSTTPYGYIAFNSTIDVLKPDNFVTSPQNLSFNGGNYTIAASYLSPVSYITVNGFKGRVVSYSTSSVTYSVPPLLTTDTQAAFNLAQVGLLSSTQFTVFSDQNASVSNASVSFDGLTSTFYSSPNTQCWIGLDAGVGLAASISRISFFPNLGWTNVASKILYSTFQGSNDQNTWKNLAIIDQTVHTGWNVFASSDTTPYRYIRFVHNSTSKCNLAEIQLYGIVYSTIAVNLTSQPADVIYNDGLNTKTFANAIVYQQANTPVVTSVSPRYGDVFGNYTLTLSGTNLDVGTPVILIDGVSCAVTTTSATSIACTVGARATTPSTVNNFTVNIGPNVAILQDTFLYVLKWSNAKTWGVDSFPIDNDLVYVPVGLTLLVDQNTPVLNGIAVQGGNLIFSDDQDLTVEAGFITINGGTFVAGTEKHPHTNKLTFILHGNYYGKQQPMFGNKGIGCLNCQFSMYGTQRNVTWTTIAATINPQDLTLTLNDYVDWKVDEEIVVASTSFNHFEAEQMTIKAISGKTITVSSPFQNTHVSLIETYGNDTLVMQAEVGLLTRNIKVMGDSDSATSKYGSHLMLTGQSSNGFEAQVAYTEFTQCGQPQILGRYCIHFHMAGDIPTSFARGNAVHDSHARVITIHGVHYLTVENNVGYRVHGHNFFVQDGIQTHNVIRNNLAISSLTVTNMLQTDISVASFWITNPTNDFYGNRAAGGDFYGIWYEIKPNPDGPSATMDVCPMGNPLGYVANNVAHSYIRFGLRIFILAPRLYPCSPVRNDSDPNDPWSYNPSIPASYSNFTIYKNMQDGVLAQQVGSITFNNFTVAESYRSGFEFYQANFTKEAPVINNSVIIGQSNGNANSNTTNYTNMSAVITGRSGVWNLTNIRVYNFPVGTVLQTCRFCDDALFYTNLGTEVFIKQLTLTNVTSKLLKMIGPLKRDVIYDTDGSLSVAFDNTIRSSSAIVQGFNHISKYFSDNCPPATAPLSWDNTLMCSSTVSVRRIMFTNLNNVRQFIAQPMKVMPITNINQTIDPNISASNYTTIYTRLPSISMEPKQEKAYTWSLPFVTGKTYSVWWGTGIDFSHLSIFTTPLYNSNELSTIFKFNYTLNRETFHVGPMRGGVLLNSFNYVSRTADQLDVSNCSNGDYHNNNVEGPLRLLQVCVGGKNRTKWQYTQINAVVCQLMCPAPAGTYTKENFLRLWSNATQWPNGTVPKAGDNVTVNGNWTVLLDVDPNPLNYLVVDGTLIADDTRNVNITANSIHIRAGNITAGSPTNTFFHNFTIQINGRKTDNGFYVDPIIAGSKYLVVTGSLNLFGNAPSTVQTFLLQTAFKGDTSIYVNSSTDWAVGDSLAISPSFSNYNQYQLVTIQGFNSDGSILLSSPLKYTHYGSNQLTINNTYGTLDARTRVAHLNRNIKIVPGPDYGWGFTVIVYAFMDGTIMRIGSTQLSGVQFSDGGQLDTLNAPLTFMNNINSTITSTITGSSFTNCKANCIYIYNSQNVTVDNNVFYNAWVIAVEADFVLSVVITNNLIIGVNERPTVGYGSELVSGIALYQPVNPATDGILVTNNTVLGSQMHGFAFSHIRCSDLENNPFANNTVGSTNVGFVFTTIGQACQGFSYAIAFGCSIGQICGPPGIFTLMFSKFIMADNLRGITLKFGASEGNSNHSAYLYNSYVTAVSRPTCNQCYASGATKCSNALGLRMLTVTGNGEHLPGKVGVEFDTICKAPVYDGKTFFYNVVFDSFQQDYTESTTSSIAQNCNSNFVMRPHPSGFDMVSSVNLYNSYCTNCDSDSYLLADAPNTGFLGWFGGCGDIVCTGYLNYLVTDWNGTFFGVPGSIIPNQNNTVAVNQNCVLSKPMNAYMCPKRLDFAVLEYQNAGPDFQSRINWPVNLTADGYTYTSVTNAWREWVWLGTQPQNKRMGRFVSIINQGRYYNMTFQGGLPPTKLQFQLQKRSPLGNSSNYVIVRLYYPLPNMIRTLYKGQIVDPILLTDYNNTTPGLSKSYNLTQCGSNAYFYNNYTISLVITEEIDCLVTIELADTIQLTTHFAMNISDFFNSNSSVTNFINNLCALLNIRDTSRVKVVGVYSGSTIVSTAITEPITPNSTDPALPSLNQTLNALISNGTYATNMSGITGFGNVIGTTSVYHLVAPPPDTTTNGTTNNSNGSQDTGIYSSSSKVGLIVGVVMAGVVLVVGAFFTFIYCIRRRSKIAEKMVSNEEDDFHQKSGDQHNVPSFLYNENVMASAESGFKIHENPQIKMVNVQSREEHEILDD